MKSNLAPLRGLAVAGLAAPWLAACTGGETRAPMAGDPAPTFSAVTLEGDSVGQDDLLGAPYMLNIWATWCAPCRQEMPELQELHDAYADQGFRVVGVSVDDRSSRDLIRAFADELDITFPLYHDTSWQIMDAYFLPGLPGSFLVDARGTIVRKWTGPFRPMAPDVQADVQALLAPADEAGG